ncbi:MAG: hypothetical protein ABTA16_04480 [Niallia sp.]
MEVLKFYFGLNNVGSSTTNLISLISDIRDIFFGHAVLSLFSAAATLILLIYLFIRPFEIYGKKLLWIYSSMLPSIILILIRVDISIFVEVNKGYLEWIVLLILLIGLFSPLAIQLAIITNSFGQKPNNVSEMNIIKIHTEGLDSLKLMEYFVVMILPFITIGNQLNDGLTITYVFFILIIIFIRLDLFYFNLPIMIFYYLHEVTLSDGDKYFLISKKKHIENDSELPRNIIILSTDLKIAILVN